LLKASRRSESISFYSNGEFDAWKERLGSTAGWTIKYYKGLGTSTKEEAREWFERLAEIYYDWDGVSDESISLAFHKKRSDDRKVWLSGYNPKRILDIGAGGRVTYTRFINDELIHFSNADNLRSLPNVIDGLKPSQRKILFGCFKRGLRSEVKVAQLAGYVSEHAAYHHGEASLCATIVGMAQNFVGSNNLNLLVPQGQFGSRLMGGEDSASARYIFTFLEKITDLIFRKEDMGILNYLDDDGTSVEPDHYYPIIPMLLVNGCVGIGTGFSTNIPQYNPADLAGLLRNRLTGKMTSFARASLKPWWYGFKGAVIPGDGEGTWITKGVYTFDDATKSITITELPVGSWTKDYKTLLDTFCTATTKEEMALAFGDDGQPVLKSFDDLYTDEEVRFVLFLSEDYYEDCKAHPQEFEKRFRLTNTWRTSNMVAFDSEMKIVKYSSPGEIADAFYGPRLKAYETRRLKEMERLRAEAVEADAKARFIRAVLEGSLELRRATDEQLVAALKAHSLPALSGSADSVDGYDYLLRLRMDRVKANAIVEAEESVAKAKGAVEALENTTASALWLKDLDDFEAGWATMLKNRISIPTAKKAVVSKTKAKR
jgi:DNA topoisomerase-2